MLDLGQITTTLTASASGFLNAFAQAERAVSTLNTAVTMVGVAATAAFAGAVTEGLRFASTLEQMQIGFETMLGSADAASTFIRSMQDFAARTPFQFEDVAHGAKRMMAMGIASEFTLPLMTAIGDRISALGGGAPEINRVITALGQMYSKGRVATQELNQLSEVGIGGFRILAAELGKTVPEVINMVEAREIDAATFLKAFMASTSSEVGGMMEKQSQTLIGLVSTLKDRVSIALGDAAQPMIEPLKAAIPEVTHFLGAVLTATAPLIAGLGQVATTVQGLLARFNALEASTQQGLLGMAGMGVAATVLAGMVASVGVAMLGVVTAIAPFASALAAVLAPEILVPILGALAAGAAVAAGAVTLFFGAFGQEGEAAWDTLNRIGTNLTGVLAPALASTQQIGESLIAGFQAGFIKFPVSLDHVTASLVAVTNQMLDLLATIAGNDLGASKWEVVGGWVARLTASLLTLGTDVLALVMNYVVAITSAFGPLIAAVSRFGEGLFGLVTGTKDVGDAFWDMGAGILGALGSILNAVMVVVFTTIATLADYVALYLDSIPGTGSMSAGLKGVGADMRATATTMANELTSAIVGTMGVDITGFNMELDAASVSTGGFNMEVDAASNKMSSYAHSLDKMVGVLSGVTKAARAPKTPEVPKSPELPPILPGPGIEVGSDYGSIMQGLFDLKPYEQVIGMEITSLIESMALAASGYGRSSQSNLSNDELSYFAGKIEEAQAKLDAYNERLRKAEEIQDAYNKQMEAARLALRQFYVDLGQQMVSEMGRLGELIQSVVSGAQSGGVWGAVIAALVEILGDSLKLQQSVEILDAAFANMASAFDPLVSGVHMVATIVLQAVSGLINGLAPVFGFIADVLERFAPLLMVVANLFQGIGGIFGVFAGLLDPLLPIMEAVFYGLYYLFTGVGIFVVGLVRGVQAVWNAIIEALVNVASKFGLDNLASDLASMLADTAATDAALTALLTTSYDAAQAQAAQTMVIEDTTTAMNELSNSMTNIPTLFKTALVAFQSADASSKFSIPAFATGGLVSGPTVALIGEAGPEAVVPLRSKNPGALAGLMGGGRGDTIINIESITIQADNPEKFFQKLNRLTARQQVQLRGTPLFRPGKYSTR